MPELSPAAQAIVQALNDRYELCALVEDNWPEQCLAAALTALADQVAPEGGCEAPDCCLTIAESIRADILAIATELEGADG